MRSVNDIGKDEALRLSMLGIGYREIMRQIPGVTKRRIRRWRKEAGLPSMCGDISNGLKRAHKRGCKMGKRFSVFLAQKRAFKEDQKAFLSGDESTHWANHRTAVRRWQDILSQKRERTNPHYRIKRRLRCRIWKVIKGANKSAPTLELTGCDLPTLKRWLESQFKRGMKWDNMGSYWEIDHKIPCASFDLTKPEQQRLCFHYSNLQPLTRRANRQKHAKIITTQPELLLDIRQAA
jgi:hypothetical protein